MAYAENVSHDARFCLSVLTLYELEYSIHSFIDERKKQEAVLSLKALKDSLDIIGLSADDAAIYGELKAGYKKHTGMNRKAIRKHNLDIGLASLAITHDFTVISGDSIYLTLQKVLPRLRYENWLK
jgi:predicted nucleic acid-binding protein